MNKLFEFIFEVLNVANNTIETQKQTKHSKRDELEKLEIELAKAISDAERWGDLTDPTNFRTARVNELKRIIEVKRKYL